MTVSTLSISLIIPTYSRPDCVCRALEACMGVDAVADEIIIVDSSDNTLTRELCEKYTNKFNLLYLHSEKGLTLQRNVGLLHAHGDIIGFFDDDIVPDKDFFSVIRSVFMARNDISGVTPYIYENDRSDDKGLCVAFMKILGRLSGRYCFEKLCNKNHFNHKKLDEVVENVITNGCTFYKKEVFQTFSFADWMQGYCYGEDIEFGLRVASKYKVVGAGLAKLHHYHESSGRDDEYSVNKMKIYNFIRILDSNRDGRQFLLKLLLLFRMNLTVLIICCMKLARFKIKSIVNILLGTFAGNLKVLPLLVKNTR